MPASRNQEADDANRGRLWANASTRARTTTAGWAYRIAKRLPPAEAGLICRAMADITVSVGAALDRFVIELPSWGFANTGTRFGKFVQAAAATTIEEKLADAGQVHALTGACPTVALHALWDLPLGAADVDRVLSSASEAGIRPGAINPNLFEQQQYAHGSFGNPDPMVRAQAIAHYRAFLQYGAANHASLVGDVRARLQKLDAESKN